MEYTSKLIEQVVQEISKLPGIGKKTALRLALHLLGEPEHYTQDLTDALNKLRKEIKHCKHCHAIADQEVCSICKNTQREQSLMCVVETSQDIMAIEKTGQYKGLYHVVGGLIDPLNGVGPEELNLEQLPDRFQSLGTQEIIIALPPTMPGDTTTFYISKLVEEMEDIRLTAIARGISIGSELEYVDEITLGRSILSRTAL